MYPFHTPSMLRLRAVIALAGLIAGVAAAPGFAQWPVETQMHDCAGNVPVTAFDDRADRSIRRTDSGATADLSLGRHRVPELVGLRLSNWSPSLASTSLFEGCWSSAGGFVRLEVAFKGLVNPPGRVGISTPAYAPFEYGPNPVSGFIEIDVDDNVDTGGNYTNPENTYTGNIARFGGLPTNPELFDRIARLGVDVGEFTASTPHVERSGEDFHLALFGDLIDGVTEVSGDGDGIFEAGEVWTIRGPLLHRAHGYAIFTSANGDGEYEPVVDIEFRHDVAADVTVVSLVYPLNNQAAAMISGSAVQPSDDNGDNDNSIYEGLLDLKSSLANLNPQLPQHPAYPLIDAWNTEDPAQYLDASHWRVTCLVGMSYPAQDLFGAFIAWTDAYPSVRQGDFNGDGVVTADDVTSFDAFVSQYDGVSPIDNDNAINGRIMLSDFGPNFSLFDLDDNGSVDEFDRAAIPIDGDVNRDGLVTIADASALAQLLLRPDAAGGPCGNAPQTGACCIAAVGTGPDICFDGSPMQCQTQGGVFQGLGTTCVNDGCVLPSGACCAFGFGAAFCFDATLSECGQVAGAFHGLGTTCDDPGIDCQASLSEGACCLNSPALRCTRVTQSQCANLGGVFQGVGSDCGDPNIPCSIPAEPVPCCDAGGSCSLLDPQTCLNLGGLPFTDAASCNEVECPTPVQSGACCVPAGGGLSCTDTTAINCAQLGGTFVGDNTQCANTLCGSLPPRACCLPNATCQPLPVFDCIISGGTPGDVGEDCATINCITGNQTTGACCITLTGLASDRCVDLTQLECANRGGTFIGAGTTCDAPSIPCPSVATTSVPDPATFVDVLLGNVNNVEIVMSADIDRNGVADGRDVQPYVQLLLSGGTVPLGACCLTGFAAPGICVELTPMDCASTGGEYKGDNTHCVGSECPILESISMACCLPDGCMDITPADCAASGGTSDPDALSCHERASRAVHRRGDINHDGHLDGRDIRAFIERLMEN